MRRTLVRMMPLVALVLLVGTQSATSAAGAEKADKKARGQPKAGTASRNLDAKLVGEEEALDQLTVSGESNSTPCETCEPSDPLVQDKTAVPVPGSSGSAISFMAQEEARAAGARLPAVTNPYINFFQTAR